MTRTVCETCGRYQATERDWDITEPGEESPEAPPEGLCWGDHSRTTWGPPIPRWRVERWLRHYRGERWQLVDPSDLLRAILSGKEPPE